MCSYRSAYKRIFALYGLAALLNCTRKGPAFPNKENSIGQRGDSGHVRVRHVIGN